MSKIITGIGTHPWHSIGHKISLFQGKGYSLQVLMVKTVITCIDKEIFDSIYLLISMATTIHIPPTCKISSPHLQNLYPNVA